MTSPLSIDFLVCFSWTKLILALTGTWQWQWLVYYPSAEGASQKKWYDPRVYERRRREGFFFFKHSIKIANNKYNETPWLFPSSKMKFPGFLCFFFQIGRFSMISNSNHIFKFTDFLGRWSPWFLLKWYYKVKPKTIFLHKESKFYQFVQSLININKNTDHEHV